MAADHSTVSLTFPAPQPLSSSRATRHLLLHHIPYTLATSHHENVRPSGLLANLPQKLSGAYHGLRIHQVNEYHQLYLLNKQTHMEMGPSCKIGNLRWLKPSITPPVHRVTNTGVRAALQRSRNGE
uniref:Uncharacterized protein n=1 Tax=Pipistrellus kuhlii TaxID=59472 RepID=A0A7J7XUZ0_PIPKU|nr:hypothetical protein mPipKuh1_010462 [Pipistrellus kuhlii]